VEPWFSAIRARAPEPAPAWCPRVLDPTRPADVAALEALVAGGAVASVADTLLDQLGDLVESRAPGRRYSTGERAASAAALLGETPAHRYGRWVFYPWSGRLVHLLPPDTFRELRADRNRYRITAPEQARLRQATIGIIGLSVGQAAALTLALEGVGGRLRLADHDTLDLSNLNRLRAGVHELGLSKCVIAARQLAEIDPYLDVEVVPEGVHRHNVDQFLDGLDLLVEECDDLLVKVLVRERARARRIPVVMDTSERGLVDIERFDREPDRPVLHGLVGDLRAETLAGLQTKDKVPFVLRILGEDTLSPRFAASLPEIRETLSTWPQLASGVALGGALVTDVTRRILLGELTTSGRFNVDVEAIIADGAARLADAPPFPADPPADPASLLRDIPLPPVPAHSPPDRAVAEALVAAAILAPSGHNAQPWRFRWADGALACRLDPARRLDALDFADGGAWVALGAAVLNVELAARAAGLAPRTELFPDAADPDLGARVHLGAGPVDRDPLFPWIGRRVTNRRLGTRVPLGDAPAALAAEVAREGSTLVWRDEPAALDAIGVVLGGGDRLTFLTAPLHAEVFAGMRWNGDDVRATRDGLDVSTLGMSAADVVALRVLAKWPRAALLGRLGGGRALEQAARDAVAASSAVAMIVTPGDGPRASLRGGRALQRMWLRAEALGLAIHPVATLPYLFARLAAGGVAAWGEETVTALRALEVDFRAVFPRRPGHTEVLLFRVGVAPPADARAVRRPVADVFDPE
jgi:nitroreductase